MGRFKKYKTKRQIKDKNRKKSSDYYYRHRDQILDKLKEEEKMMNEVEFFDPKKVTLGFVWFCFSKLPDEKIHEYLEDFRGHFFDVLHNHYDDKMKKNIDKTDSEMVAKVDKEVEEKVTKNHSRAINDMIAKLNLRPSDWKKELGLEKWDIN